MGAAKLQGIMMNNWDARRQVREMGICSISHYAPRNADGNSIKTGRFNVLALRLIHVSEAGADGELTGKIVSLFGGEDGANALLDGQLGLVIKRQASQTPSGVYALPQHTRIVCSSYPWPFVAS